jgi:hypothetical protein
VPVTVLRATQFHEFPVQVLQRVAMGPVTGVPRFLCQTVAARSVGALAAELAADPHPPDLVQVGGPEAKDLVTLCRAVVRHMRLPVKWVLPVPFPGRVGRATRSGALTLTGITGARVAGPSFQEWLGSPDPESALRLSARRR